MKKKIAVQVDFLGNAMIKCVYCCCCCGCVTVLFCCFLGLVIGFIERRQQAFIFHSMILNASLAIALSFASLSFCTKDHFLSFFVQYFCKDCISATTSFNARREFFVCRCIIIIKLCFRFIYSVSSKTHNSKPLFHSLIQPHKHTHTHRHTDIIFSSLFFHSMCNKRTQLKHMSDIHFCLFSVSLLARSSSLSFFVLDLCSVLHCCFVSLFFFVFPSYCLFYTCFARLLWSCRVRRRENEKSLASFPFSPVVPCDYIFTSFFFSFTESMLWDKRYLLFMHILHITHFFLVFTLRRTASPCVVNSDCIRILVAVFSLCAWCVQQFK